MNQIKLIPITEDNKAECIRLKPREDQVRFVAPNVNSLQKAQEEPSSKPFGIYHGHVMVGFALFDQEPYPEDGCYWIVRFMVDEKYQGNGYGKAALKEIIELIRQRDPAAHLRISHVPDNTVVNELYKKLGFVETGEVYEGETLLDLHLG